MLPIFLKGGAWRLSVRGEKYSLHLPLPAYVLADLLESVADLCAFILPLFGLPNYAELLCGLLSSAGPSAGEPLLAVDTGGVRIRLDLAGGPT